MENESDAVVIQDAESIRNLAMEVFGASGWVATEGPARMMASFSKEFVTAVGIKTGHLYVLNTDEDRKIMLSGCYWSEGRNAVEPLVALLRSADQLGAIRQGMQSFVRSAEQAILGTYAARLALRSTVNEAAGSAQAANP